MSSRVGRETACSRIAAQPVHRISQLSMLNLIEQTKSTEVMQVAGGIASVAIKNFFEKLAEAAVE
jgi:hypothetical protein